jgi:ribonuclease BN (tRNA processing enzyme)
MKVRILGSAVGAPACLQYVSSYLLNDGIAIDAGTLGLNGTPVQQSGIRNIFLTHCHLDHIATLPSFLENTLKFDQEPVAVYGHPETLTALQRHIFNDIIWPDFVRLTTPDLPFLRLCPLEAEVPFQIDGLSVVPVAVDHLVPTYGYIMTDGSSTVIFGGDSGPTHRIWQLAGNFPAPRTVFLEASFPNAMERLANDSLHLTPRMVAGEISKMPEVKTIIAVHIKASFREETVRELYELNIPNLVIGKPESDYHL